MQTIATLTPPKFPAHAAARTPNRPYRPASLALASVPTDSDPIADELLRRAREARQLRLETEAAYLEAEQQFGRQVADEIALGVAA